MSPLPNIVSHISPSLLREYAMGIGQAMKIADTAKPKERSIIFAEWKATLDSKTQTRIEADMLDIDDMKNERATARMIETLVSQKLDGILPEVETLKGGHDRAMWFFLRFPEIFREVARDEVFETSTGWTAYSIPRPVFDTGNIDALKETFRIDLGNTHYIEELRGKQCHIDYREHNGYHCFSAYPEDYGENAIEYNTKDGTLNRDATRRPVMHEYVMYDAERRILRVKIRGGMPAKKRLARVFPRSVLNYQLDEENDRMDYAIERVRDPDFRFDFDPSDRILSATLVYTEFQYPISKKKITLQLPEGEQKS